MNPLVLLMKSNTFLVAPPIPEHMPLQMDIIPNVTKLKFEDFDTQQQEGLERTNYMVMFQTGQTGPEVLKPMKWVVGIRHVGLINLLFMLHFGHSI